MSSRVAIRGEVKRPAYYEMKEEESLAKLIEYAGGFTSMAYTKSISLQRNDENFKTVKTVRADDFESVSVQNGDQIEVGLISGQFKNRIRIEGAVNHPSEFEFVSGMKLSEVISLSDGFRPDAFMAQALIIRENQDLSLSTLAFDPSKLLSGDYDTDLQSGDLIKVQSIYDLREDYSVTLDGEVLHSGEYPYVAGMTVENLIYMSGGFKETAAKSFVEVARRIVDDSKGVAATSEIFTFPIDKDLNLSSEASTFILAPFDLVVIRQSPFYEKQLVVQIEGEVEFPGKYVIKTKDERISDLIQRTGGLTNYAYLEGATLVRRTEYYSAPGEEDEPIESKANQNKIPQKANAEKAKVQVDDKSVADLRREELEEILKRDTILADNSVAFKEQETIGIELDEIMKNPRSSYDLILKEGDVITVPRELQTVRVRGLVLYPSTVRFDDSFRFTKFVSQAGGFSDKAHKRKSYIIYPNGTAASTRSFLGLKTYPRVKPGSEIIIPEKPNRRRISPQEVVGITTGLATIALIINNISKQ